MGKVRTSRKVAVLTGGGDCPGLNAVIRGVVTKANHAGYEVVGLRQGWRGLLQADNANGKYLQPLSLADVDEIHLLGGTILGSSRTNPNKVEGGIDRCVANFRKLELDALVAIGGEDTLGVASDLYDVGLNIVGVPKTIDNDLLGTDYTFGFDTTVNICTDAMDRLRTTAKSHDRILVLEVMGRHAGWIAAYTAIAGGADVVSTPEQPLSVDEMVSVLKRTLARGKKYALVVVAEGAAVGGLGESTVSQETDAFGHKRLGGIGEQLAAAIDQHLDHEVRSASLGHIQRGGSPSAADRILATTYGLYAMKLVLEKNFGKMAALKGSRIEGCDLRAAREGIKTVPEDIYRVAKNFFA